MQSRICVLEGSAANLQTAAQLLRDDLCDVVMFHLGIDYQWYIVHRPERIIHVVIGFALRFLPNYATYVLSTGTVLRNLPYHNVVWRGKDKNPEKDLATLKGALSVLLGNLEEVPYK